MKEEVQKVFDALAPIYENNVDTESIYNSEYERPAMMNSLPGKLKNMKILDAGCAAGWYTEQLLNCGADVVAIDISEEMLNSTKRRVGDKARVLCLDLESSFPFDDNTFDFIISSLTLHYIKDWHQTFREFQRILKANGYILFSVHHPMSDIQLLEGPDYFSTELIIDKWKKEGKEFKVPFYRRPLQEVINTTLKYFSIEEIIEPQPTEAFKLQSPNSYERLMKSPQFLIIKALQK